MSSSKIDRALHGPSWTEVLFGAVLSAVLGVVLAVAHLVFKPVLTVREMPKEIVPNQVYFLDGSKTAKGGEWLHKRQMLCEGRAVEFNEAELNTAVTTPTEKPKGAPAAAPAPASDAMIVPGPVSFRIADSALQLALPIKISLLETSIILQARGGFERSAAGFRYAPNTLFLGSLPVHRLPAIPGFLMSRIYATQNFPEDLSAAWAKLSSVTVEGKALKLGF